MKTIALHHLASLIAIAALANGPVYAQQAPPKWVPTRESITISAAPTRDYRIVFSASRLGEAFIVSASVPVPYSDLNLTRDPDATELGRRIHVAAHLVCQQLDTKYPPALYPIVDGASGMDCERAAAKDGMVDADKVIASARQ